MPSYNRSGLAKDFTPATNVKVEGAYENDRNACYGELYADIIKEAYGVTQVIIAHHLVFVRSDTGADGFQYTVVEEIPSADTLIFDHEVALKIFGPGFKKVLVELALEPVETRDDRLSEFYYGRAQSAAA